MPYKMHISKIKVLAYLQSVAILKVLIIAMLEISESSDYNRVALWLFAKSYSQDRAHAWKTSQRMLLIGVMELGLNLDIPCI